MLDFSKRRYELSFARTSRQGRNDHGSPSLMVSLSSYKRFVYPLNHAQRESWSFLVFLATHPSALLHARGSSTTDIIRYACKT